MNPLNLEEFIILNTVENEFDFIFTVETKEVPTFCTRCGIINPRIYKHGTKGKERLIRDVNMHEKRVGILINQKRYKCRECGKTFLELLPCVDEHDRITKRLREHIKAESTCRPFLQIAENYGISHSTVKRIFQEHVALCEKGRKVVTPEHMGIDEVHVRRHRAVFCDTGNHTIMDLLTNRNKSTIARYIYELEDKERIKVVTMDMWHPYYDVVKELLPWATIIIDKFHVLRMGNDALDKIRKAFKGSIKPSQRRKLKSDRYVLLKNQEDLTVAEQINRDAWFLTFPVLKNAYELKEGLRGMYQANTRQDALSRFTAWESNIHDDMKPFKEVAETIHNWQDTIFNYFDSRYTNAFTESFNNVIRSIERQGRGYSFPVLRSKVLFGTIKEKKPRFGEGLMEDTTIYSTGNGVEHGRPLSTLIDFLRSGEF